MKTNPQPLAPGAPMREFFLKALKTLSFVVEVDDDPDYGPYWTETEIHSRDLACSVELYLTTTGEWHCQLYDRRRRSGRVVRQAVGKTATKALLTLANGLKEEPLKESELL